MIKFQANKVNIYNHINTIPTLEKNKKKLLDSLKKKYNIDYLGIHATDFKCEYLYSTRGHVGWHDFFWKTNRIEKCKAVESLIDNNHRNGLMFFNSYLNDDLLNIRGEIIGTKKAGFSLLFSTISNNKIMFCLTFKDSTTLDKLNRKILLELVDDMYKSSVLIDPILFWFKKIGNLNPTKELEKELEKTQFVVPF